MPNEENLKPFKKGQSGNPKGKPKGIKNLSTVLKKFLTKTIDYTDPITQKQLRTNVGNIINLELLSKAIKGDLKAVEIVYDRVEGKAKQSIEVEGGIADILKERFEGKSNEELVEMARGLLEKGRNEGK